MIERPAPRVAVGSSASRDGLSLVAPGRSRRPVIVAGAAGLVGSRLCEQLVAAGETVLALDNLSTGDVAHLAPVLHHPRLHFEHLDVTDPLPRWTRDVGAIYNLAAPGSRSQRERMPAATVLAHTVGTWRLAELARATGARLLQASGGQVYGEAGSRPQDEGCFARADPSLPRGFADVGHHSAEALASAYAREHGVVVRIARLFDTYGPRTRVDDGRVVGTLLRQALAGRPLTIHGDGRQRRSFCHVDDTVAGLIALMSAPLSTPVNLGNPVEFTILGLAERILRLTASRSPLAFVAARDDDPRRRWPDVALAARALNWRPTIALDQGLRMVLDDLLAEHTAPMSADVVPITSAATALPARADDAVAALQTPQSPQTTRRTVAARA